jgi:hypothetical protein
MPEIITVKWRHPVKKCDVWDVEINGYTLKSFFDRKQSLDFKRKLIQLYKGK